MKIVIDRINDFEYSFAKNSNANIRKVSEALTFENPGYPYSRTRFITKFDKKNFVFKIGMLNTVIDYCNENGLGYEINDFVFDIPDISIDDRLTGVRDYQRRAVEEFFRRRYGIISVPTRGGKTFIASEILRIFLNYEAEGNFLFIVDNTTLFSQAVRDIKLFFERYGGVEVGEIRSGAFNLNCRVAVAMIQTIQSTLSDRCSDSWKKNALKKYIKGLKFLCVDEIHDNCSDSKLRIYKRAKNIKYLLCLSATPYRSGSFVQNLKLREWSGDIIYSITEDELIDSGVLTEYKVYMLVLEHNNLLGDLSYSECRNTLIFDNYRNGVICNLINMLNELKLKTLVLFSSVEHGKMIEELSGVKFISGETDNAEREMEKNKFLEGDGGCLLASNIFKKGVTLPAVEVLINADGGLEDSGTIQRKGRVLGTTDGKDRSLIIDFFDLCDKYFSKHSEARLNTYINSVGEKNVSLLDINDKEWKKTLEKWIRKWMRKN